MGLGPAESNPSSGRLAEPPTPLVPAGEAKGSDKVLQRRPPGDCIGDRPSALVPLPAPSARDTPVPCCQENSGLIF